MQYRILSSILGLLALLLGVFLLIFAIIGFVFYHSENQYESFFYSFLISVAIGILFRLIGEKVTEEKITFREGLAVAGLGWIFVAFLASLPGYISGAIPSFTDSYFESMSAFTTTGASIMMQIEGSGHTFLLWRSFGHWLGGMGIIVLTIAMLPAIGMGGMQLFKAESPGPTKDKLVPKISESARRLYFVYTALTVAQLLLLFFGGMDLFEALCHTFGTMGTGGFSPLNGSIGQYAKAGNPHALYFEIIIIIFMFLAGINFSLHYRIFRGDKKAIFKDSEFHYYLGIVLIVIMVISFDLLVNNQYNSFFEALRHASFTTVSIITTTGYGTEDFDRWSSLSKILLVMIMFIGGMAGSTGGGIKVVRFAAMLKEALEQIKYTIHPKRIYTVRMGDTFISKDVLGAINSFIFIFLLLYVVGILILATTGKSFETITTMVLACLANIGPGLGEVGPSKNFADIPDYGKWVLSYMMVLGRLELFPVLALLLPRMWRK